MRVDADSMTPDQVRAAAKAWYAKQIETLRECHGREWPQHREWIEAYLREQLRQRLIERGWRPKG